MTGAAASSDGRERLAAFAPHVGVIFGSGLAALPAGAEPIDELPYAALGWPCTAVPGHHNRLRLVRLSSGGREVRLALAYGRPHAYEGWSEEELARPVAGLASSGVERIVLTNSCGALKLGLPAGAVVVCTEVVDLQRQPRHAEPDVLPICEAAAAEAVRAAVSRTTEARSGAYVAVLGPQFETPAEVDWLAAYGDVVGMSAAPEVRAARGRGVACCLLGLVANRAGAVGSHAEVLTAGGDLARTLGAVLGAAIDARWPELAAASDGGTTWTS